MGLIMKKYLFVGAAALAIQVGAASTSFASPEFAVWLDGNTDSGCGGNGICTSLTQSFGAGSYALVTTADLDTSGYLSSNGFQAIIVSRYGSSFGTGLDSVAAANVANFVGSGAGQGGVAVMTNDAADNLYGATGGDPYDASLNQLFINAATFAEQSGHGYVGEFNGAAMAMQSNGNGFSALDLLQGTAGALASNNGEQFTYGVGPIGGSNAIDTGVTFPFTDTDITTYLTPITGANPGNVVDVYTDPSVNGSPAVLANNYVISGGNPVPEPGTLPVLATGILGLGMAVAWRRRRRRA